MELTNRHHLPDALVQAVANDPYDPGEANISVTSLIGPPQIRILRQRHGPAISEDVTDRIWSLFGQAVHAILERADQDALTERRLYADVAGWRVSGQFDRLVLTNNTLQDYKVTSAWSTLDGIKPEWEAQLNCLAHLCRRNFISVDRLQVVAIYRDWSRLQARRSADYPQTQVGVLDVPLWDYEAAAQYMRDRVKLHQVAEMGHVPPCTDQERWLRNECWAVMKKGRKTAVKLCDSPDDADAYLMAKGLGPDHSVVHRPGTYVRCEDYCDVAPFCPQFQGEKNLS